MLGILGRPTEDGLRRRSVQASLNSPLSPQLGNRKRNAPAKPFAIRRRIVIRVFLGLLAAALSVYYLWGPYSAEGREHRDTPPPRQGRQGQPVEPLTLLSQQNLETGYERYRDPDNADIGLLHFATSIAPRKTRDTTGDYVLTSIWFVEDTDSWKHHQQGQISPAWSNYTFACNFDQSRLPALARPSGRHEFMFVECELPETLRRGMRVGAPLRERRDAFEHFEKRIKTAISISSNAADGKPAFASHPIQFYAPQERASLGICPSAMYISDELSLMDLAEWRVYHQMHGIESVHWAFRDPAMVKWVNKVNELLDVQDTFRYAPVVVPEINGWLLYHDQMVWLADCFLRSGFVDEWLAFFDCDEYMTIVGDAAKRRNSTHFSTYLNSIPDTISTVYGHESFWGGETFPDAPSVAAFPKFPRDRFKEWTDSFARHSDEVLHKSVHRTRALIDVWVHGPVHWVNGYDIQEDSENLTFLHSRSPPRGVTYDRLHDNPPREIWTAMAEKLETVVAWNHGANSTD